MSTQAARFRGDCGLECPSPLVASATKRSRRTGDERWRLNHHHHLHPRLRRHRPAGIQTRMASTRRNGTSTVSVGPTSSTILAKTGQLSFSKEDMKLAAGLCGAVVVLVALIFILGDNDKKGSPPPRRAVRQRRHRLVPRRRDATFTTAQGPDGEVVTARFAIKDNLTKGVDQGWGAVSRRSTF